MSNQFPFKKVVKRNKVQSALTPETYNILKEISELSGVPISSLCSQFLEENHGAFLIILKALRKAEKSREETYKMLIRAFEGTDNPRKVKRIRKNRTEKPSLKVVTDD